MQILKFKNLFFLLLFFSQTSHAKNTNRIVGGKPLDASNPGNYSAVYVGKGCTGTLVASNLVITAAHCIEDNSVPMRLIFSEDPIPITTNLPSRDTDNVRLVTERDMHPNYFNFADDIAWLKFKGPLPRGYKPISIVSAQTVENLATGTPITLVGYGQISENIVGDNRRKTVNSTFNRFISSGRGKNFFVTGPTPGRGACYGDSGGPVYIKLQNTWYLMGATSGPDNLISNVETCDEGAGRYSSIGHHQKWIESSSNVRLSTNSVIPQPDPIPNPDPDPNPEDPWPQPDPIPNPDPDPNPEDPWPQPDPDPNPEDPWPQPDPDPNPEDPWPQPDPDPNPIGSAKIAIEYVNINAQNRVTIRGQVYGSNFDRIDAIVWSLDQRRSQTLTYKINGGENFNIVGQINFPGNRTELKLYDKSGRVVATKVTILAGP